MRKGGKEVIPRTIVMILADIDYPASPLEAAVAWKVALEHARRRLQSGVRQGYLFRQGRHYSPTPELLQAWLAEGVLI